jgi:hypothetical protein
MSPKKWRGLRYAAFEVLLGVLMVVGIATWARGSLVNQILYAGVAAYVCGLAGYMLRDSGWGESQEGEKP